MKDIIVAAANMDVREQRKRMRRLRRRVLADDVAKWSESFLGVLTAMPSRVPRRRPGDDEPGAPQDARQGGDVPAVEGA